METLQSMKSPKNRRYLIDQTNLDDNVTAAKNQELFDINLNLLTPRMKENLATEEDSVLSEQKSTLNESTMSYQESLIEQKSVQKTGTKTVKKVQQTVSTKSKTIQAQPKQIKEDCQIILFANPKSGSCLAQKFLEEYPHENTQLLSTKTKVIACNMKTYDLTIRDEREAGLNQLEQILTVAPKSRIILVIMGGDGSLGTFLYQLKQHEILSKSLDKIQFCLLPYGTGNDTAQVFGWGKQPGEWSQNMETLIYGLVTAKVDALTIWNVKMDGEIYDPYDNLTDKNEIILCSYFNLGIDAEIGTSVERSRTKSRICNKILYFLHGAYKMLNLGSVAKVKDYISHVKQKPENRRHKMIADMNLVDSNPLNMIGMNIPQMYGGILCDGEWASRMGYDFIDKRKIIDKSGIKLKGWETETSSCAEEEKYVQRYDDDKMELLGAADPLHFALFKMDQFGQARSPYVITFKEDIEEERAIFFAVDGEFYKIKKPKSIEFKVDRALPRIKMLRYIPPAI